MWHCNHLFLERSRNVLSVAKSHTIVEICKGPKGGSYGSKMRRCLVNMECVRSAKLWPR